MYMSIIIIIIILFYLFISLSIYLFIYLFIMKEKKKFSLAPPPPPPPRGRRLRYIITGRSRTTLAHKILRLTIYRIFSFRLRGGDPLIRSFCNPGCAKSSALRLLRTTCCDETYVTFAGLGRYVTTITPTQTALH